MPFSEIHGPHVDPAAFEPRRARWLAELAAALDEAARLAAEVGDEAGGASIRARIAQLRREVEQARLGRFSGVEQKPPKRSEFSQWWGK